MTRFARAKGSKASNERVPEEATSWQEMKRQLKEKQQEEANKKGKLEFDKKRQENYKAFLEDNENEKSVKWADFPGVTKQVKKKHKKQVSEKVKEVIEIVQKKPKKKVTHLETSGANTLSDVNVSDKSKKKKKKLKVAQEKLRDGNETVEENQALKKGKKKKQKNTVEPSESVNDTDVKTAKKVRKRKREGSSNKECDTPIKKSKVEERQQQNPKKPLEEMTEAERTKFEKKKKKRLVQLEKKKSFKTVKNAGKEYKRRKPMKPETIDISGRQVEIAYFDGFPIKKSDRDRIVSLRKQMIEKGIPVSEIKRTIKLERRRAEKDLAREKKMLCFNCRQSGHNLSECPNLNDENQQELGTGICFKCGSTEHTHLQCKVVRSDQYSFAQCFICKEQGHIARQCPDNSRGLYPKGGACRVCGDVTHLKKDCPKYQEQQEQTALVADTIDSGNLEDIEKAKKTGGIVKKRLNKIVKF